MANEIANEIARQIGNRALFMMGAKHLLAEARGLQFSVGHNALGTNRIRITLDASDTYTVQFFRIRRRGLTVDLLAEREGVYFDQLHSIIEADTGLRLSL